jgi:DNA-binding CsgD family transcriptional regulator
MENASAPNVISLQQITDSWKAMKPQNNLEASVQEAWKKKVEFLDKVSLQNNVVVFVLNPFSNRYLYMSDKLQVLSGLESSSYTDENGFEFGFSRAHPDQLPGLIHFHELTAKCYVEYDPQGYKDILLCLCFLYKNGNGEYVQVLQRTMVLEVDDEGRPALFISFGHYVGHIKKYGCADFVISTPKGISICTYDSDQKQASEVKTFSEQEKKIVSLLAKGDDSKTIAQKLFISPHTVDTHRRNLIKKTNCIDTTGVVAFARLINLI